MGSRDQMCINAEVMKEESNANKVNATYMLVNNTILLFNCTLFISYLNFCFIITNLRN